LPLLELRYDMASGHSSRNPHTSDNMYSSVESIPSPPDIAMLGINA
jgi:hypothetical protein